MRRAIAAAATISTLLAMSACSGMSSAQPTATVTVTSTPSSTTPSAAPSAPFESVTDLRDALVAGGYDCPAWSQHDRVSFARESGSCSDSDVLSIYSGPEATLQAEQTLLMANGNKGHLVVGDQWIVNTSDLAEVHRILGGKIVDIHG